MLRGIHKASSTWLGKAVLAVVMGFLVISFAIWGIGDIFRGFGRNSAITVGDTEISLERLREYYTEQLRQLSRRLGRPLPPDQVRSLGIDRQLIGRLVAETALDEKAKSLGLGITNDAVANSITSDPTFRGQNGQFDRMRFEQIIRDAGYTEGRFVDAQRKLFLRRQLAQSLAGEVPVPAAAVRAINQYRNEKRSIEYVVLGAAQAGDVATPTREQVSKYYDEHKAQFRAPEYRKVTLLALSPAALAKPDAISDADAKAYYEQHSADFGKPEQREIKQIVFPNAEEAKAARERLDKGESFADLVTQRGLKPSDTDLGMVTKKMIIAPAIADVAFALKPGEVSQPIEGAFGTVLLTVGKIEPGSQQSYDEVAAEIKRQMAESQVKGQIEGLRDKIEDERASGATLAETGAKLGLPTRVIDAIDRTGRGADSQPIADLPQQPNVAEAAFASDVGADTEALQVPGGGYLYYEVNGITPSHERSFDEVKDQAAKRWRDDEIAKRLQAKADEMVSKLQSGGTLEKLASDAGAQVQIASDLQRGKPAGFLPEKIVTAAFTAAKGTAASVEGAREDERYVFRVTAVSDPTLAPGSPESSSIAASLKNSYADDITAEYIAHLEQEVGVNINQSLVDQVVGGSRQ
jgi:peptidyl-prolyl cis-trans isomerase D